MGHPAGVTQRRITQDMKAVPLTRREGEGAHKYAGSAEGIQFSFQEQSQASERDEPIITKTNTERSKGCGTRYTNDGA